MANDLLSDDPPLALPFEPVTEEISLLTPKPVRKEFQRTLQEYKVFYTDGTEKIEHFEDSGCACEIL